MYYQQDGNINSIENSYYTGDHPVRMSQLGSLTEDDEGIVLRKDYAKSARGILRAVFIVTITIGWIIIAASIRSNKLLHTVPGFRDTRIAYLVIAIVSMLLSILIYSFSLFNVFNSGFLKNIKWDLLIVISDLLFAICLLAIGITCVVRETQLHRFKYIQLAIHRRTFIAAGIFALISAVLYVALAAAHLLYLWKNKTSRSWNTNNPRQTTSTSNTATRQQQQSSTTSTG